MAEQLNYGIETTDMHHRLYIDVPQDLTTRIKMEDPTLSQRLAVLSTKSRRFIDISDTENGSRIYINTKKIGSVRGGDSEYRIRSAGSVIDVMTRLDKVAEAEEKDPKLQFTQTEKARSPVNPAGITTLVQWPEMNDEDLSRITEYHMQNTAYKLRYSRPEVTRGVTAHVARQSGVSLRVNPINISTFATNSQMYDPLQLSFELEARNIHTPTQLLVCFAGAVALANAPELS